MVSALVAEFEESRHYECFGLIIEYLIEKKAYDSIDILVPIFKSDSLLKEWYEFYLLNYIGTVPLNLIHSIAKNSKYETVFYVTSVEFKEEKNKVNIKGANYCGIVHHNGINDIVSEQPFSHFTLSRKFKYNRIPLAFNVRIDRDLYIKQRFCESEIEHYFSGIRYFTTGNINELDLKKLNNIMKAKGSRCLVISRKHMSVFSNLTLFRYAPTKVLLYCLIRLRGIFLPKDGGIYHKGQMSGLIHLAASFQCPLLLPKEIYAMQKLEQYPSFIPFLNDDDLALKLTLL